MAYTDIDKPSDYFNTKLYTGNGGTLVNTGVGFQPDLVWVKSRTQANSHVWFDVIRTFAGGKEIQSNNTGAEGASDSAGYGYISAVSSDGFTAQAGTTAGDYTNVSSQNYVAWNWLANNTSGSSNTDGSITSTVSANTTSGFSIVSYTGNGVADATIGHGLNDTLAMIILKNRTDTENWWVYHKGLSDPSTKAILLNSTNAEFTPGTSAFNPSGFSTSVFSTKNDNASNSSGDNYIAYCFAEKKGFSKFGSYTGNGNADGTFIYTGFKPAFVIFKRSSGVQDWGLFDNKRSNYNPVDELIYPNYSNAESGDNANKFDFVSNGFKLRASGQQMNQSGDTYIYMAFAESPFVTSTGIPTVAR